MVQLTPPKVDPCPADTTTAEESTWTRVATAFMSMIPHPMGLLGQEEGLVWEDLGTGMRQGTVDLLLDTAPVRHDV